MSGRDPRSPARLFTTFGTVLFISDSGELQHGPIESSPANAWIVEDACGEIPVCATLVARENGQERPIVSWADGSRVTAETAEQGSPFQVVPLERGLFGLKNGGMYLSAIPDGSLRLSAAVCSTWECYLASENWCTEFKVPTDARSTLERNRIKRFIIDPQFRAIINTNSRKRKILVYGYPQWSHGRVYYELCKRLHCEGYIVDVLNWQEDHHSYMDSLISYYDLVLTAPDGVANLNISYGVPFEKMLVVSHHEMDIRMLLELRGPDIFDRFANYGVVSDFIYSASFMQGVQRPPKVVPIGVDFEEFCMEVPEQLQTVGYASSMAVTTYGVEWKRGYLAEAAARQAGIAFRVAGSTASQTSFHDMPSFYSTVDAVLVTSLSEGAGFPVMEAAAAGRLVIGTPVGHFPLKAYQGGGILAPIEPESFVAFTSAALRHFKANRAEFVERCRATQAAAQQFDWRHSIGKWIEFVDAT